jgi:hypothetical protein
MKLCKTAGIMMLAIALAFGYAGTATAQDGGGDNPSGCDWEAIGQAAIDGNGRVANVDFGLGLITADPQSFVVGDAPTFTLDGAHNSTDNIVFIADINCAPIGGDSGFDYVGPAGAMSLTLPGDGNDGEDLSADLGLWAFIDDDDDTMHCFTVLFNDSGAGGGGGGGSGPNPNNCDWDALLTAAVDDGRVGNGDLNAVVTIDPVTFSVEDGDTPTATLADGHSSTDNVIFIADINCQHPDGGLWDYVGPGGATEMNFPGDGHDDGLAADLGLWAFVDDDDDTMHGFTLLEGVVPPFVGLVAEEGFPIEGADFTLSVSGVSSISGATWTKDGADVTSKAVASGGTATSTSITFSPLEASDAGQWCVSGNGGAVDVCYTIADIAAAGSTVPASGLLVLSVLSILMAFAGVRMLRRRQLS